MMDSVLPDLLLLEQDAAILEAGNAPECVCVRRENIERCRITVGRCSPEPCWNQGRSGSVELAHQRAVEHAAVYKAELAHQRAVEHAAICKA